MSEHDELLEDLDSEAPENIKGGDSEKLVDVTVLGANASVDGKANYSTNGASAEVEGYNAAAGLSGGTVQAEVGRKQG